MSKRPKVESEKRLLNEFLTVDEEMLTYPSGYQTAYYRMSLPASHSVSIIATTADGKWVFNREWRQAVRQEVLALPGGFIEEGENPLSSAERELLEETGYRGKNPKILGKSYPMPGICTQQILFIHIEAVEKIKEPQLDPGEIINPTLFDKDALRQYIKEERPVDGILLTGLYFFGCSQSSFSL